MTGQFDRPDVLLLRHAVEVVSEVIHPQTEVSLAEALLHDPSAAVGDTLQLDLALNRSELQDLVRFGGVVRDWLDGNPKAARFPVDLVDVTVSLDEAHGVGRIVEGSVRYPVKLPFPRPIEIVIDGFTLVLSSVELTPHASTTVAEVRLPDGIADINSCQPATLDLGVIPMSPSCDFYVNAAPRGIRPLVTRRHWDGHRRDGVRPRPRARPGARLRGRPPGAA